MTFNEFVEALYRPWARANKASYKKADEVYLKPILTEFGPIELSAVQAINVEAYKQQRTATATRFNRARKPASVNRELECVRRIFSYAIECGILEDNPAASVRKLRAQNARNRYLSHEEESQLISILQRRGGYLYSLVVLAIETGARKGELINLEWSQFNRLAGTIWLPQTKTGRPREVPLSHRAMRAIERQQGQDEKRIFPIRDFKKAWASVLSRVGIENFKFHDLRHTAATRWAEAGADIFTIAALLGHHNIQTTMRYSHSGLNRMRQVVEKRTNMSRVGLEPTTHWLKARRLG